MYVVQTKSSRIFKHYIHFWLFELPKKLNQIHVFLHGILYYLLGELSSINSLSSFLESWVHLPPPGMSSFISSVVESKIVPCEQSLIFINILSIFASKYNAHCYFLQSYNLQQHVRRYW